MTLEEWQRINLLPDPVEDRFLIDEGFDLLAAYRSISNSKVRKSILLMIATLAENERSPQKRF